MADDVNERLKQMTDIRTMFLSSIISALALVVGLFWNDAIRSFIEDIVPAKEGTFYKFVAAFAVTILVVVIIYVIMHSQKVAENRIRKIRELREQTLREFRLKNLKEQIKAFDAMSPVNQRALLKMLPLKQQKLLKKKKGLFFF